MTIYVFGNPDLPQDSLPLKILPQLRQKFPQITFEVKDPNEEWDVPEELTVIDTVQGINQVEIFHDLSKFQTSPRISLHDFDALSQLLLLKKIGKLKKVTVIGVPPDLTSDQATAEITTKLQTI
jgi:hypothetical protein